ncbi:MAG TPA: hypothetical protein VN625_11190 [Desulfuromonadaceae bacterium]|nr:hypothetical protein [Desulfuromonadaceae bacterium]
MEYFVFAFFVLAGLVLVIFLNWRRRRRLAIMTIVKPGAEYPNNYHVLGVGYYHAAVRRWFLHPWNEYREDRGYYWDGKWNPDPDQRMVSRSMPEAVEVDRVNSEWRKADPDLMRQFWDDVEREGFGTAVYRSEGS